MTKIQIQKLKKENAILKRKLLSVRKWLKRMISEDIKKISKKKVNEIACKNKEIFEGENLEKIITNRISNFFGEFILMNTPSGVVDNIISGEINYHNLRKNPNFDGFSVISSYHKAIDIIIESTIIKGFRKYSKKQNQTILRKNDPLEKTLHMVVNKGYILSVGRLYHILKNISEDEEIYEYSKTFKKYLDKYSHLKKVLLNKQFLKIFDKLLKSEALGKKRHSGNISFVETRKVRELLVGDFENKESLLYMMLKTQEVEY